MATMAPCLRGDLRIVERSFRGDTSYVVKDLATQKYFRFGKTEISVMRRLDGRHTPREIAAGLAAEGIRISADVVERFARKLAAGGLLERTLAERSTLQIERLREQRRKRQRAPLFRGELLRMRWSFGDPDALLNSVMPYLRWMFTPEFVALSVALFIAYAGALGANWNAFGAALRDTYAPFNLTLARVVTLWITAGAVILIHELGHAFTCKHFGGEVRELGFMILFFQPAFYCNVNDAWSFPTRHARLWVTAAGAWIELLVTVAATFVWLVVRPQTLVADIVVAVMFIGGVTTILGNLNPLLPLDGYFALADWLEIANLRHRALAHLEWWVKRAVLRLEVPEPPASPRERRVFLIYGALASAYLGMFFTVLSLLALGWVRRTAGGLGVAAGLLALFLALRPRIMAWARLAALSLRARRGVWRGWWRPLTLVAVAALVAGLLVPWTLTSVGPFSLHPTASFSVVAPDSGVVAQVLVTEGSRVSVGAPLVRLVDRTLERDLLVAARGVDSTAAAAVAARASAHAADAERLTTDHQAAMAALTALEKRFAQLTLRAVAAGVVVTARPEELVGRRVAPGESLLVVASMDSLEARVSIGGAGATRVRPGQIVHLVSYSDVSSPWTSRVDNVASAGTTTNELEARVIRAADSHWRSGVTGEAKIEIARSSALGALWWKARQLVRGDFWL